MKNFEHVSNLLIKRVNFFFSIYIVPGLYDCKGHGNGILSIIVFMNRSLLPSNSF